MSGNDAPGIAMEYKVHVEAGKEDCYWQYVHPGATLYVSYQVLKGGDGNIGMAVRNPQMKVVHPYAWKASSEYEESDIPSGGYYSVCLDNQFSRFSAKLVNLYLTTFRYDEWEKFSQELQDMDVTVENFTSTLRQVDQRIQVNFFDVITFELNKYISMQIMRQFQSMTRSGEARDFNLIQDNSAYVQNWSIAQALVVILCTAVQVTVTCVVYRNTTHAKFSGLLCQELLQGPKRREGRWKWVQNADLMPMNNLWLCSTAGVDILLYTPAQQILLFLDANVYWENIQCYICGKYKYQG